MKNNSAPSVKGRVVDQNTRCVHYHSPLDVIAIKFKCCQEYYPCYYCHQEEAGHEPEVWKENEWDSQAILCGICGTEMTIHQYLSCNNQCPFCNASFNSHCNKHYHLYFKIPEAK